MTDEWKRYSEEEKFELTSLAELPSRIRIMTADGTPVTSGHEHIGFSKKKMMQFLRTIQGNKTTSGSRSMILADGTRFNFRLVEGTAHIDIIVPVAGLKAEILQRELKRGRSSFFDYPCPVFEVSISPSNWNLKGGLTDLKYFHGIRYFSEYLPTDIVKQDWSYDDRELWEVYHFIQFGDLDLSVSFPLYLQVRDVLKDLPPMRSDKQYGSFQIDELHEWGIDELPDGTTMAVGYDYGPSENPWAISVSVDFPYACPAGWTYPETPIQIQPIPPEFIAAWGGWENDTPFGWAAMGIMKDGTIQTYRTYPPGMQENTKRFIYQTLTKTILIGPEAGDGIGTPLKTRTLVTTNTATVRWISSNIGGTGQLPGTVSYSYEGEDLVLELYRLTPDEKIFAFIWADVTYTASLDPAGQLGFSGIPHPIAPQGTPSIPTYKYYISVWGINRDGNYYQDETYLIYEGRSRLLALDLEIYKYPHPGEEDDLDSHRKPIGQTNFDVETFERTIPVYVYAYRLVPNDYSSDDKIGYGMIYDHKHYQSVLYNPYGNPYGYHFFTDMPDFDGIGMGKIRAAQATIIIKGELTVSEQGE